MTDSGDVLLVEVSDRVATLTLNRPEARNALSRALQRAIRDAVRSLDADDEVDVMILTGTPPAFSAGVDLKELGSGDRELVAARTDVAVSARGPLPDHAKPIIGAVNGVAVTGGLELALSCDLLLASTDARFADTHARVGVMPGWGLTVLLPEAVGLRRARQMSLTGNYVDAPTALAWGLVNEVVAPDELLPRARALAADIVSNDQDGVRRMLRTYQEGSLVDGNGAWALEAEVSHEWATTRLDPASVEARRQAILTRGRAQQTGA